MKINGGVALDLTAAYDTVNHCRLLTKILQITKDFLLIKFLSATLKNRRFFVEFNNRKFRFRLQRNSLPRRSVLAPLLYTMCTN